LDDSPLARRANLPRANDRLGSYPVMLRLSKSFPDHPRQGTLTVAFAYAGTPIVRFIRSRRGGTLQCALALRGPSALYPALRPTLRPAFRVRRGQRSPCEAARNYMQPVRWGLASDFLRFARASLRTRGRFMLPLKFEIDLHGGLTSAYCEIEDQSLQ